MGRLIYCLLGCWFIIFNWFNVAVADGNIPTSILPSDRIVAFYGNFYSPGMGILGQFPGNDQALLNRLQKVADDWRVADPQTPVMPAIDYIAVTAQGSPGGDGKYRFRMPKSQIEKAINLANQVNGLVFLEVQPGLSKLQTEILLLEDYLLRPEVELAIDPEFTMQAGQRPGDVIGSVDAQDINEIIDYLANLVKQNNLPPKILIVHRFTQHMITNAQNIQVQPGVSLVIVMDGWGSPAKKINTYQNIVAPEVPQYTGFKLFYKNDKRAPSPGMMQPEQVLNLEPVPLFIQYQ